MDSYRTHPLQVSRTSNVQKELFLNNNHNLLRRVQSKSPWFVKLVPRPFEVWQSDPAYESNFAGEGSEGVIVNWPLTTRWVSNLTHRQGFSYGKTITCKLNLQPAAYTLRFRVSCCHGWQGWEWITILIKKVSATFVDKVPHKVKNSSSVYFSFSKRYLAHK